MAPRALTVEHKQAMAAGRKEGQAVKAYLDALEQQRPKRGRRRTVDSIKQRLAAIDSQLSTASSLKRLQMIQERRDLQIAEGRVAHAHCLLRCGEIAAGNHDTWVLLPQNGFIAHRHPRSSFKPFNSACDFSFTRSSS